MFVLCPHCHFLVGIDPRTGKPPANCPKCGGLVVEPLPDVAAGSAHVEEIPTAVPTPLAPFAPVELPSVLPTLPDVAAEAESATGPAPDAQKQEQEQGQEQGQRPTQAADAERQSEPAAVEPIPVQPDAPADPTPEPIAPAALEPAATPAPKPRWWSRRKTATPPPAPPEIAPEIVPMVAAAAEPVAPTAIPVAHAEAEAPHRADSMIAALQGRRRATKKKKEPAPPPVHPLPAVAAVDVEVDALTPVARIDEGVVAAGPASAAETRAGAPAEPAASTPQTSVAATKTDQPATTMATAVDATAAPTAASVTVGEIPAAPHPLRRRTDFDPTATEEPIAGGVPPHPMRRRTDAPSFTRPRVRTSAVSRIGWRPLVAVGGLSLLLLLQLLLAQRDILAASPRWRPLITSVCTTLGCGLPPWREPAAFTMLSRDVRPHPGAPGTLLINASFRNDARWSQPWPHLLLTLSDLDGRMVGARSFAADEYLGAAPTQTELAPGQTAAVTLSVVEPAPNVVAFTFDFR